jgi:hypothetical protein
VEREVGTLSAPEAPGVDSSTVFTQWQRAVVDVSATFGLKASSEGICKGVLLKTIIAQAVEVIVVDTSGLEVLAGTRTAVDVDAIINVHTGGRTLEGPICLARDVVQLGMEWRPSVVTGVQRVPIIAGVCQG